MADARPGDAALSRRTLSVPNPKSVTKFGDVSTTLAASVLLGIAPTIPRRRALPAPPIHPRLWQRTSGPGHLEDLDHHRTAPAEGVERGGPVRPAPHAVRAREQPEREDLLAEVAPVEPAPEDGLVHLLQLAEGESRREE